MGHKSLALATTRILDPKVKKSLLIMIIYNLSAMMNVYYKLGYGPVDLEKDRNAKFPIVSSN